MGRKMITRLLPLFGFLFLTAYIRSATENVVYTDYIRLVNSYLEDVWSFAPYMHGDILTRIPVNYLERIINVELFHYSTTFDMMLGAAGLTLSALIAGRYCEDRELSPWTAGAVILFLFSLNKWEMLTNGSGWVHFVAFGLFWHHYLVYDRVMSGTRTSRKRERLLYLLPWIIIPFFSGPYCGVYAVTLLIADLFLLAVGYRQPGKEGENRKESLRAALLRMGCTFIPLCLYLLSRAHSVEERAGATTESIGTVAAARPGLLPVFFVRSFSSMVIGAEAAEHWGIGKGLSILLGLLVLGCYGYAFYLNFRQRIYEKTTFPLLLLTSGFLNHVLVTASRWIFLNDAYGMSSRYALQYQVGIAGILLTLAVAKTERRAAALITAVFLAGSMLTTGREIHMAPYREEHFIAMRDTAQHFESRTDEELKEVLQYHDPVRTRKALDLLKARGLNVFADIYVPEEGK
ncbi:MAG: hypothetical protein IJT43_04100 [Stomatobaculum sp.]|nr:hypothetical protein [Stomatobaculum sp.]